MASPANNAEELARLAAQFRKYPVVLAKHMHIALNRSGERWHSSMIKRVSGRAAHAFPRRKLLNRLSVRTGMLRRSLKVEMGPVHGTKVSMSLSSRGTSYAAAQEFGARIKPKTAKWLWIPLAANMTPTGRMRISPRSLMSRPKHELRFVVNSNGSTKTVLWNKGQGFNVPGSMRKPGKAMFFLTKNVTIPGPKSTGSKSRFGFFDTWTDKRAAKKRRVEFADALYYAALAVTKPGGAA